ncbi:uncharacterized protein LOC117647478 [Thrips palmi]|uniref:Uncharacterized protein LOC117647478 n=1 Tax=Thrips palmi TaxID=161013 RepID=A0A6P8Z4U1_THRPL|nr:uncharacterized protein LOC117647478 [Thrips palmi]
MSRSVGQSPAHCAASRCVPLYTPSVWSVCAGAAQGAARALRRPSFAPPNALEPLIVVEESLDGDEDDEVAGATGGGDSSSRGLGGQDRDEASPSPPAEADVNPYLLSPWRDTRKSSLPTPACASGITASQVRRLSERGPESGPSPREQEFLATLSAMPGPTPGGRRHSVVISRVPPPSLIMFGRGRRESIAAFSAAASRPAALASSTHNLQLDLMDDLLEFKAAKKQGGPRRASELPGLPSQASPLIVNRRKSELPPRIPREFAAEVAELAAEAEAEAKRRDEGIVCSNSDLLNLCGVDAPAAPPPPPVVVSATPSPLAARLITLRNDSVEIKEVKEPKEPARSTVLVSMRGDRPQSSLAAAPPPPPKVVVAPTAAAPKAAPKAVVMAGKDVPRPAPEGVDSKASTSGLERRDSDKVMWDERSGSLVDAGVLGSAIEGFLNKDASVKNKKGTTNSVHRATAQLSAWVTAVAIWNPRGSQTATPQTGTPQAGTPQAGTPRGPTPQATPQDTPESTPRRRPKVSCDAVCSTLKSLFVK